MGNVEAMLAVIAQVGIGGIFLWLYLKKDKAHDNLQEKLLDSFTKQTEVNAELSNVISNNTKVAEKTLTVTEKVHEELLKGKK